ncbi:MAG: acyl-CoA dehydrogenase family protein, partial [Gammaproteobacteria bacterium]
LAQERLIVALRSAVTMEAALEWTVEYTRSREAFGRPLAEFQNTRFKLAEVKARAVVTRTFIDRCLELHMQGELDATDAAIAKLHATETLMSVLDDCLQLHGGYGYMWEFPIARAWAGHRVSRIAGGSSEIMKEIIARAL